MTWYCPDCDCENSDESICVHCGEPVREATRDLANGETMDVIECPHGDTKHRFRSG